MSDRDKRRVRGAVKLFETVVENATFGINPVLYFGLKFCWKNIFG